MDYEKKMEFYQSRNIGERLSATTDFLKQIWKVLLRNGLIIATPLALITGYTMPYYYQWYFSLISGDYSNFPPQIILFCVVSFVSSLSMYALPGAIMILYKEGQLSTGSGWNELNKIFFSLFWKSVRISLLLFGIILLVAFSLGFFFSFLGLTNIVLTVVLGMLFILSFLAFLPSLLLVFYPAYFKGVNTWNSIKTAFYLGFKDWGSIFVALIICIVISYVVIIIFGMPYQILTMVTKGEINTLGFILASLSSLGNLLIAPFIFIYLAFQYFSITESEEGISMQTQIDEFDNL
jgi:hypothetical protein